MPIGLSLSLLQRLPCGTQLRTADAADLVRDAQQIGIAPFYPACRHDPHCQNNAAGGVGGSPKIRRRPHERMVRDQFSVRPAKRRVLNEIELCTAFTNAGRFYKREIPNRDPDFCRS